MIAYHYPPIGYGSGVHRVTGFVRNLPAYGWQPHVVTVHPRVYDSVEPDYCHDDTAVDVRRVFSLDTAKDLSICGKYPGFLLLPDRWASWIPGAIYHAIHLIKKHNIKIIWSTYPIASAHLAAYFICKNTGLPWVADFRDPMLDATFPYEKFNRKIHSLVERRVIDTASRYVFASQGNAALYSERYGLDASQCDVIENGFNEEDFADIDVSMHKKNTKTITLLHSGLIYESERDPTCFFNAIASLDRQNHLKDVIIVLRAPGNVANFVNQVLALQIDHIVKVLPPVEHKNAVKEMCMADGLIILQARNCDHQVPAKLYEYFRAQRPVIALTTRSGDTARSLNDAGIGMIAELNDQKDIETVLSKFILGIRDSKTAILNHDQLQRYSRKYASRQLAQAFDDLASEEKLSYE